MEILGPTGLAGDGQRRQLRSLLLGLCCALMLSGCGLLPHGTPEEARTVARDFVSAIRAKMPAEGWALLDPVAQRAAYGNDPSIFATRVESSDARLPDWKIEETTTSDDGWYLVFVRAEITRVPAFLLEDGLIQPHTIDGRTTGFTIIVRYDGAEPGIMLAP